ncbi:MAG: plasmid pRiA4b ORF-3 family protein [Muribaculaceae bacterium]|nr:plasmid pRiA4b ORF-3 family protein [Muribaculaceae bacterium]
MTKKKDVSRQPEIESLDSLEIMAAKAFNSIPQSEKEVFSAMLRMALMGITPDDYAEFYRMFEFSGSIVGSMPPRASSVREYKPMKDAASRTLVFKIQMKDVTKPPMWREVEVPAGFTFTKLHRAIQIIMGLDDEHLWQFNKKAYDGGITIGHTSRGPFDPGLEEATHDADKTPLTMFFQNKGDKLEYVYDFGDDWIFAVELKDVVDKKIKHPGCLKYKGDLNAIEDIGGAYSYMQYRDNLNNWDKLPENRRNDIADELGFTDAEEYIEFLRDCVFDMDVVNERLGKI